MDLAALNAFGRPAVQPSVANPTSVGIRQVADPREAQIPVSPLAARNAPDLRQSVGPRQSSSTADAHDEEDGQTTSRVRGKSGAGGAPSRAGSGSAEGERGSTVDVTI